MAMKPTREQVTDLLSLAAFFGSMTLAVVALEGSTHLVVDLAGIVGIGVASGLLVEYLRRTHPHRPPHRDINEFRRELQRYGTLPPDRH